MQDPANKENKRQTTIPSISRLPQKATQPSLKRKADAPSTLPPSTTSTQDRKILNPRPALTRVTRASQDSKAAQKAPVKPAPKPAPKPALKPVKVGVAAKSKVETGRNKTAVGSVSAPVTEPPLKKKRKEYDIKGRLQDLEELHNSTSEQLSESTKMIETMTGKLDESQKTIKDLLEFKFSLESKVVAKELEKTAVEQELLNLEKAKKELLDKHALEIQLIEAENEKKVGKVAKDLEEAQRELANLKLELDGSRAECAQYKVTISTQSASQYALESERSLLKTKLEASEKLCQVKSDEIASLKDIKAQLEATISEMETKMHEEEQLRRYLHNEIQELKGNIRVFCRVRPLLEGEEDETALAGITFPPEKKDTIELYQAIETASGNKQSKSYPFTFDKIFQPETQQAEVFEEISQLVQSALDGYNICIFAYGQTGSGKTFTMEGPNKIHGPDDIDTGMIPRAVKQIYAAAEKLKEKGWTYTMEAQFLEIYNETLRDLLSNDSEPKKHEIRHDHHKCRTTVTDATNVIVESPEEVFGLLARASKNRAVAATNCNERSSRSHSVFTLRLSGINTVTDESCYGVLNLIDLAGSERLSSSGSTGDRLKETQAINKSLSCLGDVIYSLANKDAHIPYRNSKLTYLLQHSLGGNSKTLMFVNVSPLSSSFQETLCSLRFATKVNNCQIGTARKQITNK